MHCLRLLHVSVQSNLDIMTLTSLCFSFRGLTHEIILLGHSARELIRNLEPGVDADLDVVG
jgi:hypothetical protein